TRRLAKSLPQRVIGVSGASRVKGGVYMRGGALVEELSGQPRVLSRQTDWPALIGAHNGQNAAAATAAALMLGLDGAAIDTGLRSFKGLAHRLEPVAHWRGIRFINDSKATNTDAAATALASFAEPVRWIAGGRAKSKSLGAVARHLDRIAKAYLIGEAAPLLARLLAPDVAIEHCETIDRAVARAAADCGTTGGIVLLAPACASFDQFRDFEARGEAFRQAVARLMAEEGP
ncbi:MAG: UDP-N-acetylmuramoyl-L-alanine--D-glutamate ligase, partial [Alphaproteobacteria bacterium]